MSSVLFARCRRARAPKHQDTSTASTGNSRTTERSPPPRHDLSGWTNGEIGMTAASAIFIAILAQPLMIAALVLHRVLNRTNE
jgi:hypothetical protein